MHYLIYVFVNILAYNSN